MSPVPFLGRRSGAVLLLDCKWGAGFAGGETAAAGPGKVVVVGEGVADHEDAGLGCAGGELEAGP